MDRSLAHATARFSNRVEEYVRYRPNYPQAALAFLVNAHGLRPGQQIADIGSGTGIFTETLLRNGNSVFAVEPNREMRQAAESRHA